MVGIPKPIQDEINSYVARIGQQIPIEKAILFGSYAKGNFNDNSDIDIAIFSRHFTEIGEKEAFMFLFMQTLDFKADLQPLAFTVEDYENPIGIVDEIIKTGVELPIG
ncbi:MAG: nucleotidyltransferase domain-containing protein [Bacillota bacterium]